MMSQSLNMLQCESLLEPDQTYSLSITAKKYWLPEFEAHWDDDNAVTLIVLHSTSFHKETWQPSLERIFQRASSHSRVSATTLKIKCAWAVDCPNHGVSAALNEEALQQPPFHQTFGCRKYAEAVHRFMSAGQKLTPTPFDFRNQRLVGIGHSLGGVAITILQNLEPTFTFSSIILVEPMLSPSADAVEPLRRMLIKYAYQRRDAWPSRECAYQNLKSRKRTESWDPRVLELYVKFGLRDHPASHLQAPSDSVTLACSREEEVTMYREPEGATKPVQDLDKICSRIPVSIVFGGENDYLPRAVHDALINPASGRRFSCITRIDGAGHLVPQQAPDQLGERIFNILSSAPYQSKL